MENRYDVARDLSRKFVPMSIEAIHGFGDILIPVKYAKGSIILDEGDSCDCLYYIYKGFVRQFYMKNGKDLTEHFSYEGMIVMCIESLFKKEPTKLMIEALENTKAYAIPYDELLHLCQKFPEVSRLYSCILEESLIKSQVKADMQRFETAAERYHLLLRNQPEIFRRAPLNMIASFLQMTPETLSRVRANS